MQFVKLKQTVFLQSAIFFAALIFPITAVKAQPPSPTPVVTGKSYSSLEIERPSTTAPQFPSPVTFTDITAQTAINFRHYASPTSVKYLPETMGAGVGLIDYDNDGRLDIFFTNGAQILDPMPKGKAMEKVDVDDDKDLNLLVVNDSTPKQLYLNKGNGTFEEVG